MKDGCAGGGTRKHREASPSRYQAVERGAERRLTKAACRPRERQQADLKGSLGGRQGLGPAAVVASHHLGLCDRICV